MTPADRLREIEKRFSPNQELSGDVEQFESDIAYLISLAKRAEVLEQVLREIKEEASQQELNLRHTQGDWWAWFGMLKNKCQHALEGEA